MFYFEQYSSLIYYSSGNTNPQNLQSQIVKTLNIDPNRYKLMTDDERKKDNEQWRKEITEKVNQIRNSIPLPKLPSTATPEEVKKAKKEHNKKVVGAVKEWWKKSFGAPVLPQTNSNNNTNGKIVQSTNNNNNNNKKSNDGHWIPKIALLGAAAWAAHRLLRGKPIIPI